jgi:hypothetical protein
MSTIYIYMKLDPDIHIGMHFIKPGVTPPDQPSEPLNATELKSKMKSNSLFDTPISMSTGNEAALGRSNQNRVEMQGPVFVLVTGGERGFCSGL